MESNDDTLNEMKRKLDSIQKKQKEESSHQYETLTEDDKRQVFENPTFLQHNKGNYNKLRATSKTLRSAMDRERVHIDVRGTISKKFNNLYKVLEDIEQLSQIASFDNLDLSSVGDFSGTERSLLQIIGQQSNSLTSLNLSHGHITSDATDLADALVMCTKLNCLDMSNHTNFRQQQWICTLTPILSRCTTLTELNVSENDVRGDAATIFAHWLPKWTLLTKLDLNGCRLGDAEIYSIKSKLSDCKSLEVLKLGNNLITDLGASYLVEVLPHCISLHVIYLNNNNLGDPVAEMFEKMFEDQKNGHLKVAIYGNKFSETTLQRLRTKHMLHENSPNFFYLHKHM